MLMRSLIALVSWVVVCAAAPAQSTLSGLLRHAQLVSVTPGATDRDGPAHLVLATSFRDRVSAKDGIALYESAAPMPGFLPEPAATLTFEEPTALLPCDSWLHSWYALEPWRVVRSCGGTFAVVVNSWYQDLSVFDFSSGELVARFDDSAQLLDVAATERGIDVLVGNEGRLVWRSIDLATGDTSEVSWSVEECTRGRLLPRSGDAPRIAWVTMADDVVHAGVIDGEDIPGSSFSVPCGLRVASFDLDATERVDGRVDIAIGRPDLRGVCCVHLVRCQPEEDPCLVWTEWRESFSFFGTARFGNRVAYVPDVNGDRVPDVATTDPRTIPSGGVEILSGSSGATLVSFDQASSTQVGTSLSRSDSGSYLLAAGALSWNTDHAAKPGCGLIVDLDRGDQGEAIHIFHSAAD